MYARVKKIGSRRYIYLAQGVSRNGRVRQKTLAYLGPITRVVTGVSNETKRKIDRKIGTVDWNKVNADIRKIPLEIRELEEMRRKKLSEVFGISQGPPSDGRGSMPRAEGELAALTMIAENRFQEMFEPVGQRTYRMRLR
jgi:hypothetical protein